MITTKEAIKILENLKPSIQESIDVCSICSERGGAWVKREDCTCTNPCPDCFMGEIEVRDDAREFDIDEKWKTIKCETCNGEGEIEL